MMADQHSGGSTKLAYDNLTQVCADWLKEPLQTMLFVCSYLQLMKNLSKTKDRHNKCCLQVANETMKDQRTVDIVHKLHKNITYFLSRTIIGDAARQEIQTARTNEEAMDIFLRHFENSMDPRKMTAFLRLLNDKQQFHAREIRKVHQKYLNKHSCGACDVWQNMFQIVRFLSAVANTSHIFKQPVSRTTVCRRPRVEQETATENIQQNEEKAMGGTHLRTVIIDGANVARKYGRTSSDWKGVAVVMNHFLERGHKVLALIPHWAQQQVEDTPDLSSLRDNIEYSPHRQVAGSPVTSNPDVFMLEEARRTNGIVVTNNEFADHYKNCPDVRDVIANRLLQYRFIFGQPIFPLDPLGGEGPRLEEFLQQDIDFHLIQAEFEKKMKPAEIGFTKKKIDDVFDKGKSLKETFSYILLNGSSWMRRIDCVKAPDGRYYAQDGNKRLFLLKILEEGQKLEIKVNIMLHDPSQFPSETKQLELEEMNPGLYKSLKEIMRKQKDPVTPGDATQA